MEQTKNDSSTLPGWLNPGGKKAIESFTAKYKALALGGEAIPMATVAGIRNHERYQHLTVNEYDAIARLMIAGVRLKDLANLAGVSSGCMASYFHTYLTSHPDRAFSLHGNPIRIESARSGYLTTYTYANGKVEISSTNPQVGQKKIRRSVGQQATRARRSPNPRGPVPTSMLVKDVAKAAGVEPRFVVEQTLAKFFAHPTMHKEWVRWLKERKAGHNPVFQPGARIDYIPGDLREARATAQQGVVADRMSGKKGFWARLLG